jgi:hypothetical protein
MSEDAEGYCCGQPLPEGVGRYGCPNCNGDEAADTPELTDDEPGWVDSPMSYVHAKHSPGTEEIRVIWADSRKEVKWCIECNTRGGYIRQYRQTKDGQIMSQNGEPIIDKLMGVFIIQKREKIQ